MQRINHVENTNRVDLNGCLYILYIVTFLIGILLNLADSKSYLKYFLAHNYHLTFEYQEDHLDSMYLILY